MNTKAISPFGDLGRDPMLCILKQSSPLDQLHVALASKTLYGLFGSAAQKNLVYSFSVIPEGALEHPIFAKYPPNFAALVKFLRIRARNQKFIAGEFRYFDYEEVWPLAAIMGHEAALRELIGHDPKREDANYKNALDYLAFCGHKEIMMKWIRNFYPDFEHEDAPLLHYFAALGGSEEIVFMLIEEYGYSINDSGGKIGHYKEVTLMHPALWGKHTALLRRLIDAGGDLNKSDPIEDNLALHAAEMGLWDFYEEFKAKGVDLDMSNNYNLFIEAAASSNNQDKLDEFLHVFELNVFPGEYICHAAIKSGQKEMVDLCVEKGWVDIKGVFSSRRIPKKTKDKDPALFVAAAHEQIDMFVYLVEKYGLDTRVKDKDGLSVLDCLISRATWINFEYIARRYFNGAVHSPSNFYDSQLCTAIGCAELYKTQQYIKTYCDDDYLRENAEEMISIAEDCGNPYVLKWLKYRLAPLMPSETHNQSDDLSNTDSTQLYF